MIKANQGSDGCNNFLKSISALGLNKWLITLSSMTASSSRPSENASDIEFLFTLDPVIDSFIHGDRNERFNREGYLSLLKNNISLVYSPSNKKHDGKNESEERNKRLGEEYCTSNGLYSILKRNYDKNSTCHLLPYSSTHHLLFSGTSKTYGALFNYDDKSSSSRFGNSDPNYLTIWPREKTNESKIKKQTSILASAISPFISSSSLFPSDDNDVVVATTENSNTRGMSAFVANITCEGSSSGVF
jgi:hypothetical protein